MAWRDAGDGEGIDWFAGATGTVVVHLFDCDCDKCSNMTRYMVDKGEEEAKQDNNKPWQTPATAGWVDKV